MNHVAPQLIVLSGLPGTGKSTIANLVGKELEAPVISTDATRIRLGYQGRYAAEEKFVIYDAFFKEIQNRAATAPVIILDGSFSDLASRAEVLGLGRKLGRIVQFFHITATEESIKERLKATRKDSEADFLVYKTMEKSFAPFSVVDVTVLDTSEEELQQTCSRLLKQLHYEPAAN